MLWNKKIRYEMAKRDMNYSELARRVGRDRSGVAKWIRGEHQAPSDFLRDVADLFDWPLAYLLDARARWPYDRTQAKWIREVLHAARGDKTVAYLASHLRDPGAIRAMKAGLDIYVSAMLAEKHPPPPSPS